MMRFPDRASWPAFRFRALLALVLGACVPGTDGAPCDSAANCPSGQICESHVCSPGTGGTGGGTAGTGGGTAGTGGGTAGTGGGTSGTGGGTGQTGHASALFFLSNGGGSVTASGGTRANLSIVSQPVAGRAVAPGGASVSVGSLSVDAIP
jgi:hypothetical protein